jgi:hypothetical protein
MKRTIPILLLTFFYFTVACGLSVNFHYCGSKLKDISFFSIQGKETGCCGSKKKSKGCCKDKYSILKIEDDHRTSADFKLASNTPIHLFVTFPLTNTLLSSSYGELICPNYHAPPFLNKPPIYLNHRVLII